jgi:hypothetical protein
MKNKYFTSTFKKSTFKKGRAKPSSLKKRHIGLVQPFPKVENKNDIFFRKTRKTKQTNNIKMQQGGENRFNEQFIELMEKLSNIMLKRGETFRARAYQKAQETIMAYPDDIVSVDQLKGKPAIGSTIL